MQQDATFNPQVDTSFCLISAFVSLTDTGFCIDYNYRNNYIVVLCFKAHLKVALRNGTWNATSWFPLTQLVNTSTRRCHNTRPIITVENCPSVPVLEEPMCTVKTLVLPSPGCAEFVEGAITYGVCVCSFRSHHHKHFWFSAMENCCVKEVFILALSQMLLLVFKKVYLFKGWAHIEMTGAVLPINLSSSLCWHSCPGCLSAPLNWYMLGILFMGCILSCLVFLF